jgi:hypothetical protein
MMDLTWILIVVAVIQTILAAPTFIRELASMWSSRAAAAPSVAGVRRLATIMVIASLFSWGAVVVNAYRHELAAPAVPLSDIRLNILHSLIYPPSQDNKKNPAGALIVYTPANNHPVVGISHNGALKFYDKPISKQEEDAQMKVVAAPMPAPLREGNEVPPGQEPSFAVTEPSLSLDEWNKTIEGGGTIYIFVVMKYYGSENMTQIRTTEFCRYISRTPLILHSCDGHNRTYTEQ